MNSNGVKRNVVFKDETEQSEMYRRFMRGVYTYVQMGKNLHDDGVDALAMLALYIQSLEGTEVEILSRASLGF